MSGSLPYRRAAIFILSGRRDWPEGLLGKSLGTHRFQRAVSAKDLLIGISRPQT